MVPGSQEMVSGKDEGLGKKLDVSADESSQTIAGTSVFLGKEDTILLRWLVALLICLTGAPMKCGLMRKRRPGVQRRHGLERKVVHVHGAKGSCSGRKCACCG